jgi:hypothetical protein
MLFITSQPNSVSSRAVPALFSVYGPFSYSTASSEEQPGPPACVMRACACACSSGL